MSTPVESWCSFSGLLSKVWTHSACTWPKKLRIYNALIESKLLYSVSATSSMCLTVAETRRLDGFQNRCIRKILGIKPSFISRVSNAAVLEKSKHPAASSMLRKRQLQLFGKIFRCPENHPLRLASFVPGLSSKPATEMYVRRRGRPAKEWIPEMIKQALNISGGWTQLHQSIRTKPLWNDLLYNHFSF